MTTITNNEKQKFAARLNEALDDAGVPLKGMGRQSSLVRMLGVSHRVAKKWLDGEEFPPTSKMVKLATELHVRSNWLFSGQGDKVAESAGDMLDAEAEVHRHADALSQEAFEVASEWMKLPQSQRVALRKVIRELGLTR
ncbi:hypothetical protein [Sulfuriflexus sp.]|uniref:hypothetical protein n=1 Tax=Sulfuriflexus sp. TaxID=2015443 RepID=UPI0028CEB61F|nr:hypothetical protein [Sulfuriflexus sp.]MDT8403776.1 hypothetical protein [Sulfuriflexus sp.]